MEKRYSIFEAKAKFSEVVRTAVAEGQVIVTQRGVPVIKIIPYVAENQNAGERLANLERIGRARIAARAWPKSLTASETSAVADGAVKRFFEERK